MEYSEIKAFLNDTPQYGETTGVERAGKLLELLGNPDKNLKIIHIAGTNGKGSVCSYIDDILKKSGYKTGLFTSPHLVTIRERIQVDGELISREDFTQYFNKVYEAELADVNRLLGNTDSTVSTETSLEGYSGGGYVMGLSDRAVTEGGGIRNTVGGAGSGR